MRGAAEVHICGHVLVEMFMNNRNKWVVRQRGFVPRPDLSIKVAEEFRLRSDAYQHYERLVAALEAEKALFGV